MTIAVDLGRKATKQTNKNMLPDYSLQRLTKTQFFSYIFLTPYIHWRLYMNLAEEFQMMLFTGMSKNQEHM